MKNKTLHSATLLIGTTVGIGMFGVPFAFLKAGFFWGIFFLGLITAITLVINLALGEVALRTRENHQIAGYAHFYLGTAWKKLVLFSFTLTVYSALLVYTVISGEFLANILAVTPIGFSPFTLSVVFFMVLSTLVYLGLNQISWLELVMTIFLIVAVGVIFIGGVGSVSFDKFSFAEPSFWFLPYGVLLFALRGFPAIPLQREFLRGKEKYLKKSIIWGTLIPSLIFFIFAFVVVGISGELTTPEAISGLAPFIGFPIIFIVSLFGLLAISTSYLGLGLALQSMFQYDFSISKRLSWALTIFIPFLLFLAGIRNLINIMSLAGSVAIGLESIIFIFLYQKIKKKGDRIPEYSMRLPQWSWYALILLFGAGIVYALL
ncbi:MAG: hypothetical protein COV31_00905 [Candidatus Yanofskybacteria bacterium CG10_big_fil_rev_8_21_14_0_10_46_23]|uniref:Amino acid transporter transmembrane domain-containing protein n=1 Tax=Candidatus Yanofskybacteria bacterium CG10_big_fil_rev_8_21_14_0_10_46_23 TaxID=1975098 RepID=A0A2H0R512_9BACT|nr:MAG: hypothetical protein COV31_00905 [Candidatus Yanofskybacteria bacterium CG10_big_fil_rev_8_21_14_0_10_46_23]